MPEDNAPQDPQIPKPQPQLKSLDGFTNSPKPVGPPIPPNQSPNSFSPESSSSNQLANNLSPSSSATDNQFGSGGVSNPTVSGMAGLQSSQQHSSLPKMPEPAPQSQTPVITTHKKSHKKLWLSLIVLLVLLGLGTGYVFAFYLPNQPNNVYKSSLTNTGLAADKLISYSRSQQNAGYKSSSFDGKLNVKSPAVSFDANYSGDIGKSNGQVQAAADIMGQHVSANAKYITKSGNDAPDIYVQVSGVKTFLNQNGLGAYAKLDSKWITIDHTLLDSYRSSLQKEAESLTNDGKTEISKAPSTAQIYDAIDKVQVVNKQYIFTTDSSKAVLTQNQYVGKETLNGRTMYHYKVGYNKSHLKAYVSAVCQALDNSQLNDWVKQTNGGGRSISDILNCSESGKNIDQLKSDYTFDMWADVKTKLISKLTFTDTTNKNDIFSLSQNYTGGVVYPFSINLASKDDSGNPSEITLGYNVNSSTHKVSITLNANTKDSSGTTTVTGNLNVTPSKNDISVTAPTGSEPITDVLKSLGLESVLSGGTSTPVCAMPGSCSTVPLPTPSPSGVIPGGTINWSTVCCGNSAQASPYAAQCEKIKLACPANNT